MKTHEIGPILVVCADPDQAREILAELFDKGLSAVGPAPTAGVALTLASQTVPQTAILVGETTGRRNVEQLASELKRTWGIECFVLADDPDAPPQQRKSRRTGRMAALREALGMGGLRRADMH